MEKYHKIWLTMLALLLAFALGWIGNYLFSSSSNNASNVSLREKNDKNKFTNPLLLCDTAVPPQNKEFRDLKNKIQDMVDSYKGQGVLKRASVYYRDLDSGSWVGINEDDHYSPASLLKVPTMIALLKFAEQDPGFLKKEIWYDGSFDDNRAESIKPLKAIESGKAYTEEDLIARMVGYSDNNATRLLDQNINTSFQGQVYSDLGIDTPSLQGPIDFMSVKNYSYFFRILYNASYLNREMSEKALAFLSLPDFPQGIAAGLPQGVVAAQKFGERVVYSKNNPNPVTKELHDCGIVYYPEHPYLLCIMTEGNDLDKLAGFIKVVSSTVYREVEKRTTE